MAGTVNLSDLEKGIKLSDNIPLRKQRLSEFVADELLKLFRLSVTSTVIMTVGIALVDFTYIGLGWVTPQDRLINQTVLMAVIGASIVQLGAAMAAIVYALFAKPPASASEAEDADAT